MPIDSESGIINRDDLTSLFKMDNIHEQYLLRTGKNGNIGKVYGHITKEIIKSRYSSSRSQILFFSLSELYMIYVTGKSWSILYWIKVWLGIMFVPDLEKIALGNCVANKLKSLNYSAYISDNYDDDYDETMYLKIVLSKVR